MAEKRCATTTSSLENIENTHVPKKKKVEIIPDFTSLTWKLWVLLNYEYKESSFTLTDDIYVHSLKDKEHLACDEPSKPLFNRAVEALFGKNIYHSKKGSRNEERRRCYRNLSRKDRRQSSNNDSGQYTREENGTTLGVSSQMSGLPRLKDAIPSNWVIVTDRPDRVSFVRIERWEFCDQRVCVDLLIAVDHDHSNRVSFTLRSHGGMVNLNDVMDFDNVLKDLTISEKVSIAIEFIEKSPFCTGYILPEEKEEVASLDPSAVVGNLLDHSSTGMTTKCRKVFSKQCELFASPEGHCKKCRHRERIQKQREHRKKERLSHDNRWCNYRFMTRQELEDRLRLEKQNYRKLKDKYMYLKSGQNATEDDDSEDDDGEVGGQDEVVDESEETGDQGDETGDQDYQVGDQDDQVGDQNSEMADEAGDGDGDGDGDADGESEDDHGELKMRIRMAGDDAMVISSRILYNIQ